MEDCVLKIFNEYDTPVNPASSKPKARAKKVIIRLSKRKVVFNILQTKKKLKSVDIKSVGLPNVYLIFMNRNLCSYFKYLWSLYKSLHLKKMIHSFWVSNGNVSVKLRENTPMILVTQINDLVRHFEIKGLSGNAENYFFLSYSVVFISCAHCVHFSCFAWYWYTINTWKHHLREFLKKSTLEIYKLSQTIKTFDWVHQTHAWRS